MPEVTIKLSDLELECIRKYICVGDETPVGACTRVIVNEIKNKRLVADLCNGGAGP
jgi:hypothetical protein